MILKAMIIMAQVSQGHAEPGSGVRKKVNIEVSECPSDGL